MSGRFFSLPFIFSLTIILTNVSLSNEKHKYGIVAGLITFILFTFIFLMPKSSIVITLEEIAKERGICDERGYYYKYASLWRAIKGEEMPNPNQEMIKLTETIKKNHESIILQGAIGFFGYYVGSSVYVLDIHCLADPFRSRLDMAQGELDITDDLYHLVIRFQFCNNKT
jgi:hypothetical protein